VSGFTNYGTLNIKALDGVQLQSLNNGAGVATVPLPVLSGSTYIIPPPPNYDAALIVPVPSP
jgi:hypothetical protein